MSDQKGTGKHPHKDTEEPYPHHEAGTAEKAHEKKSESQSSGSQNTKGSETSESADLKSREYKDEQGNVHHHTHTAGKK